MTTVTLVHPPATVGTPTQAEAPAPSPAPSAWSPPLVPASSAHLLDERETCDLVHDAAYSGYAQDLTVDVDLLDRTAQLTCPAYAPEDPDMEQEHCCRKAGHPTPCAFRDPELPAILARARQWKRVRFAAPRPPYGQTTAYRFDPRDEHPENELVSPSGPEGPSGPRGDAAPAAPHRAFHDGRSLRGAPRGRAFGIRAKSGGAANSREGSNP